MSKLIVRGGTKLYGEISAQGSKNAVLPILAATLLVPEPVRLRNAPKLSDVYNMLSILEHIGCEISWEGDELIVNSANASCFTLPERVSKELRSSIFMLGSVIARFKEAIATYPGGCEIGNRPIDLHLAGLRRLNTTIVEEGGSIRCRTAELVGATVQLDYPSVGATENIMLAGCGAVGRTLIYNAAREPEIVELQNFLNSAGFCVSGGGSSTVVVEGGRKPHGTDYRVMSDRIVVGTYLVAGAISGGKLTVTDTEPGQLSAVLDKLSAAGCDLTVRDGSITLAAPERPSELVRVDTFPYPGFPTDMQAQLFALCSVAKGTSVIVENVFENRFKHAHELRSMGGENLIYGRAAVVRGVSTLYGADVTARDLRGGAALVLAGLRANGTTVVHGAEIIDRGYAEFEKGLASLGAAIERKD